MTTESLAPELIELIKAGMLDGHLEEIQHEVTVRQRVAQMKIATELKSGDHVRVSKSCRPKMLAGTTVEFVGLSEEPGKIRVRLLGTYSQKWRKGNVITMPFALIGGKI